ncbi:MAG TPA: hypothetical protein VGU67_02665 [Edaphobacter sp.]|nr:hypothetical protein [Edaphobacter sp.]
MRIIEATTEAEHEPSRRYRCRHLFVDGHRCGSPSLRGEHFCYYHHTTRGFADEMRSRREGIEFELPQLEDRSSILAAITEVLQRIACDKLPSKQAGLLLYGLQIASQNLPEAGEASSENQEDRPEEVITNSRYGDLAPVAEFIEDAKSTIAPGEPSNANGQPASAEQPATPQTQVEIKTPQPPRLFVSYGIHKSAFYKEPTPEPTETEPAILPNLNTSADPQHPKQLQRSHPRKARSHVSKDRRNTRGDRSNTCKIGPYAQK